MNDSSPRDPRFDEPSVTRQVEAADWSRAEIETSTEAPPPKERLFPRKVLIGWALFALALYFGVRIVGTVIRETVKGSVGEAVRNTAAQSGDKDVIYRSPNGKIIVTRNKPNGSITISTDKSVVEVPAPDAAAPKTPTAVPAPKAVPAPRAVPAPTKR